MCFSMNLLILNSDLLVCIILVAFCFVAVRDRGRAKLCNYGHFTKVMGVSALQSFLEFDGVGNV